MGMSASAHLAWGVPVGDPEDPSDLHPGIIIPHADYPVAEYGEPGLYELLDACGSYGWPDFSDHLAVEFTGSESYECPAVILKRDHREVYWGKFEELNVSDFYLAPTWREGHALEELFDYIGFTGDRTPKLLLFSYFG